jgi:hypothetical protein
MMFPDDAAADSTFLFELQGWAEEVFPARPLMGVNVVDEWHEFRLLKAHVSEERSGCRPVLLFNVCVVIFPVRAASGERYFSSLKVTHEVVM